MLKLTAYRQTVAPTQLAITLAEVKTHLRIDGLTDVYEDALIEDLFIPAAIKSCEDMCRRALVNQTFVGKLDCFDNEIVLPRSPLVSVTSIVYRDTDGNPQTLAADTYDVDTMSEPGRILLAYDKSWPTLRAHPQQVTITWVSGYGGNSTTVPTNLRQGLLLLVGHWYDQRATVNVGNIVNDIPWTTKLLFEQSQLPEVW